MYVTGGIMGEAYIYAHIAGREGYGGNGEECMRVCVVCECECTCVYSSKWDATIEKRQQEPLWRACMAEQTALERGV